MKRIPILTFGLVFLLTAISPVQTVLATAPAAQPRAAFIPYQRVVMLLVDPQQNTSANIHRLPGYGDLYSWAPGETSLFRETHYGYNDAPIMSPDGSHVVYLSLPDQYSKALERGEASISGDLLGGPPPTNIWLMDLTKPLGDSARFKRIAAQVTELPTDSNGITLQRRSQPVWSPDSAQIAWLELDLDYLSTAFGGRIMVYDMRTGTTHIAARGVSLGFADGGFWDVPDLIGWGNAIAHTSYNAGVYPNAPEMDFGTTLDLFDANSYLSTRPISYFNDYKDQETQVRWLQHGNEWRVGVYYPNLGWVALDTSNSTFELLKNPPFIGAITKKGWTGHLVSPDPAKFQWRNDQGSTSDVTPEGLLLFNPEGIPVWISSDWHIKTLEQVSGIPLSLPVVDGLQVASAVWTPTIWMMDGEGTPIQPSITP